MNSVLYWNSVLLEVSRRDFTRGFVNSQNPGPIGTSRAMAMVHLAIRDALALPVAPAKAYLPAAGFSFPGLPATGPARSAYLDDVVAGAASALLTALYPGSQQYIEESTSFASLQAFGAGQAIGNAVLASRDTDGAFRDSSGNPVDVVSAQNKMLGYGDHRADPFDSGQPRLGVHWGNVDHFAAAGRVALDPFPGQATAPSYVGDPHYRADYDEVKDKGSSGATTRTPEEHLIGVYWGYDGANNLGVPPRLYNQIVRAFVREKLPTMSRERCADLFAIVNCSMADAGIDAWHWKYHYDLWRPVVGIRQEIDKQDSDVFWAPLGAPQTNAAVFNRTPNFPAYPSGHATFGAAIYQVLRLYFRTTSQPIKMADVLAFDSGAPAAKPKEAMVFVSDELDGRSRDPNGSVRTRVEHPIRSFAQGIWENSVSRVYLGVHWRFDGLPERGKPNQNIGGVALGLENGSNAWNAFKNRLLETAPDL